MRQAAALVASLLLLGTALASLNADYYAAPKILQDSRHPLSYSMRSGNIVTVGHFRGVLKQGVKSVCNTMTCYKMPRYKYTSRGWADLFVSVYNSSRILQWTRTAGGDGDDKARAVNVNIDGNILVTGYITGVRAKFSGLTLSSRSALSRTIFVASYTPSGSIAYVVEAAACVTGKCDVTSIATDETGTILTGKFRGRISFGVKESCTTTAPVQCIPKEHFALTTEILPSLNFEGKQKSTGSGVTFNEYCWVSKYDVKGGFLWAKYCDDPAFEEEAYLPKAQRTSSFEQREWSSKASQFFDVNPKDATGLLGKESAYAEYAARRVPYGI